MPLVKEANGAALGYEPHEVIQHHVQSEIVAQVFNIKVLLPIGPAVAGSRFPVLYVTDSDDYFGGLATIANTLQLLAETRRFILVGIGYGNSGAARLLRWRDFKPRDVRAHYQSMLDKLSRSPLVAQGSDLSVVTQTTDARDFLRFIREELMPFIDSRYPTLSGDNSYSGYSAGGGFGLYTLFTEPETFRRYIIGSPGASYNGHHYGIDLVRRFIDSRSAMRAELFISVGELEEFERGMESLNLVTGYYSLVRFLRQADIPGLNLVSRVFPGETHATAWTLSFSHGLRSLMGPDRGTLRPDEFFK
jgi:uncharacterized protein